MTRALLGILLLTLATPGAVGCRTRAERDAAPVLDSVPGSDAALRSEWSESERRILSSLRWRSPPPDPTDAGRADPKRIELGHALFADPGLSSDGTMSCATCHDPTRAFADGKPVAEGRVPLHRNTPSLLNVAHQRWLFWDGRIDTLWGQALEPIENPHEMASSRVDVLRHIASTPRLRRGYEASFGDLPPTDDLDRFPSGARPALPAERDPPADAVEAWNTMSDSDRGLIERHFANVGRALAAYEATLTTPESRFDRYVDQVVGEEPGPAALDAAEVRGLRLFIGRANCRTCHHGPVFSDLEFHDTRVAAGEHGRENDPGRYAGVPIARAAAFGSGSEYSEAPSGEAAKRLDATEQRPTQFGEFRTPGLRGVADTAPYMHAGQFETLEAVIRFYSTRENARPRGHHEEDLLRPLELEESDIADLAAFLRAL